MKERKVTFKCVLQSVNINRPRDCTTQWGRIKKRRWLVLIESQVQEKVVEQKEDR
jgi:hypothetical protein